MTGTGETVECYNCGRANPAWAQVCRSCGVPIRPGAGMSASSGPIPRDRDSLVSMGAILASILGAIVLGVILSGMIPEAPVAVATPSHEPSRTPRPSRSFAPSSAPSGASVEATPALIGSVAFGTGINNAEEATGATDTFGPGSNFCHSVALTEPFGVDRIQEEVLRVEEDGSLTEVQPRRSGRRAAPIPCWPTGASGPSSCATTATQTNRSWWPRVASPSSSKRLQELGGSPSRPATSFQASA